MLTFKTRARDYCFPIVRKVTCSLGQREERQTIEGEKLNGCFFCWMATSGLTFSGYIRSYTHTPTHTPCTHTVCVTTFTHEKKKFEIIRLESIKISWFFGKLFIPQVQEKKVIFTWKSKFRPDESIGRPSQSTRTRESEKDKQPNWLIRK